MKRSCASERSCASGSAKLGGGYMQIHRLICLKHRTVTILTVILVIAKLLILLYYTYIYIYVIFNLTAFLTNYGLSIKLFINPLYQILY